MSKEKARPIAGWFLLNKPYGVSSSAAVNKVKYVYQAKKAGHAGTLDPLATGMLPIALGEATKTVAYVMNGTKSYEFTIAWGEERNTDDLEGEVENISAIRPSYDDILNILPKYQGCIKQFPPKFSALKINGQRAYELARKNQEVNLSSREVTIHKLNLLEHHANATNFLIECSKGTYIRSIARAMGRDLGCFGYIAKLHRNFTEPFQNKPIMAMEALTGRDIDDFLLPIEASLVNLEHYVIDKNEWLNVNHGRSIIISAMAPEQQTIWLKYNEKIAALGVLKNNLFKPTRVFQL